MDSPRESVLVAILREPDWRKSQSAGVPSDRRGLP